MTKHSMHHVFRADVKGQAKVLDGVWFEADEYTREDAKAQFRRTTDGGYERCGEIYSDVTYLGIFREDRMPQTDSECAQALIDLHDDAEYDLRESLDVHEAALFWTSRGKDEEYTFEYTEEELENALRLTEL